MNQTRNEFDHLIIGQLATLCDREIEDLNSDNLASITENTNLREVSLADHIAIENLRSSNLENAWKYTSKREEGLISFGREQQGAGFDMEYASKLLNPFQRLHSARDFSGSGVGLACVARVVHKHAGRIWAHAAVGQGASFFFTVPRQPAAARVVMPVDRGRLSND